MVARASRLLPGLALSLVGCAVAGAVVTTLPVADYAADPATARFVWLNLSLLGFAGPLPGVFAGYPVPAVNGSLWTLQYEAACYAILAGLGLAGLRRRWVVLALLAAGLVAGKLWLGGALVEFGTCLPGRHDHGTMAAAGPGLGAAALRRLADYCRGYRRVAAGLRHGWRVRRNRGGYGPATMDRGWWRGGLFIRHLSVGFSRPATCRRLGREPLGAQYRRQPADRAGLRLAVVARRGTTGLVGSSRPPVSD